MFALKEFLSWFIVFTIIILNAAISNSIINNVLLTLFYVLTYTFCTNRLLSLCAVVILGLIFDSVNNISIGVSSSILIAISLIHLLENKITTNFVVNYVLGLINILILVCYIKLIGIFLNAPYINLITFYIIGIIGFTILLPIALIANKILSNAK